MAYKRGKLKKNGVPKKKPRKRTTQKGEYRDRSGKLKGKKRKKNPALKPKKKGKK